MAAVGVIAEYNPFHKGHAAHLARAKKHGENIIAVMSGNFVQRGEPAVCDKYYRTKMALLGGADLVIELPAVFACASAGYFANGAVRLMDAAGIVDRLCFGSESGDTDQLMYSAKKLTALTADEKFNTALRGFLKQGKSYPSALQNAAETASGEDFSALRTPNNTLGVEYIKVLAQIGSAIEPVTVPRSPGSAREIRQKLGRLQADGFRGLTQETPATEKTAGAAGFVPVLDDCMPDYSAQILREALAEFGLPVLNNPAYNFIFKSMLLRHNSNLPGMPADLQARFMNLGKGLVDITEMIAAVKSKNYTYLRLQRAVLHSILGITDEQLRRFGQAGPQYIRVLGFRRGREHLLKALARCAALPVVTNLKNAAFAGNAAEMLEFELEAGRLYYLAVSDGGGYRGREEYREGLVVV